MVVVRFAPFSSSSRLRSGGVDCFGVASSDHWLVVRVLINGGGANADHWLFFVVLK